ncbi:MAG: GNAT family N-acetyltransferase [Crocinitomicaceae bacterium]
MFSIVPASLSDLDVLVDLGRKTFVQSHGHSAPKQEINDYLDRNYTQTKMRHDLEDSRNNYYLFLLEGHPIGYSNIVFNVPLKVEAIIDEKDNDLLNVHAIAKLDRIYILETYHGKGYAQSFFDFQVKLAKEAKKTAMWLYVWVENYRAIGFYEKIGFRSVGTYDFEISPVHRNPNWVMLKEI